MTGSSFHLVSSEWNNRRNRDKEQPIAQANFRYNASLSEVDYAFECGLDRNHVEQLVALEFVRESKNLFITRPTGTGKSYLATTLGYKTCHGKIISF